MIIQKQSGGTIEDPRVCGYDASGIVKRIGTEVKNFKIGDEVFYASSLGRQGTFAPFHAVDSRVVSKKPESISHVMAAGMPLVTITAWEGLLERLEIPVDREFNHGRTILVVNGGGGLGSMVIQLAKKVLGLTVIATSSREETM
jgi:NADPH:quinone reductase-like Zn-dependent oxidoreductase